MQKFIVSLALFTIAVSAQIYQDIEGFNNGNGLGAHERIQPRLAPVAYEDGTDEPRGGGIMLPLRLPSARLISNVVSGGDQPVAGRPISDWHTFWGQFLDHDFTLIEEAIDEPFDIIVPDDDQVFLPGSNQTFFRSPFMRIGGVGPREFVNEITSYVDASNVYGADDERALGLRSMTGGLLLVATDDSGLPPLTDQVNAADVPMASLGTPGAILYAAGDVRANENAALLAVHTLWVREHNRLAAAFAADPQGPCAPMNTDECLYQEARRRVIALNQVIFENEYSALLFGPNAGLLPYAGFDNATSAELTGEFSIVFRYGHSEINDMIMRDQLQGLDFPALSLNQVFFNPMVTETIDIDAMLAGMTRQQQREIDARVVDAIRNTLFMEAMPGTQAMDLVARNIQRARDHGVPDLNTVRMAIGLPAFTDFDFCFTQEDCDNLSMAYNGTLADVDLWIGAVAEEHLPGNGFGTTLNTIIGDQYNNLVTGDEFWFRNTMSPNPFSAEEIMELDATLLSDVIIRNSIDIESIPCNAMQFQVGPECPNPNFIPRNSASGLFAPLAAIAAILALLF